MNIKKLLTILFTFILLLTMVGCGKNPVVIDEQDEKVIMQITSEVGDDTTLLDYMLSLQEDGELQITYTDSTYGAYITKINGLEEDYASNKFWMFYTDDTDETYVNLTESFAIIYKDKMYYSLNYGVDNVKIKKGKTYICALITFNY